MGAHRSTITGEAASASPPRAGERFSELMPSNSFSELMQRVGSGY
jgi:hypothetical protein